LATTVPFTSRVLDMGLVLAINTSTAVGGSFFGLVESSLCEQANKKTNSMMNPEVLNSSCKFIRIPSLLKIKKADFKYKENRIF
jgi:hypothetical protein